MQSEFVAAAFVILKFKIRNSFSRFYVGSIFLLMK